MKFPKTRSPSRTRAAGSRYLVLALATTLAILFIPNTRATLGHPAGPAQQEEKKGEPAVMLTVASAASTSATQCYQYGETEVVNQCEWNAQPVTAEFTWIQGPDPKKSYCHVESKTGKVTGYDCKWKPVAVDTFTKAVGEAIPSRTICFPHEDKHVNPCEPELKKDPVFWTTHILGHAIYKISVCSTDVRSLFEPNPCLPPPYDGPTIGPAPPEGSVPEWRPILKPTEAPNLGQVGYRGKWSTCALVPNVGILNYCNPVEILSLFGRVGRTRTVPRPFRPTRPGISPGRGRGDGRTGRRPAGGGSGTPSGGGAGSGGRGEGGKGGGWPTGVGPSSGKDAKTAAPVRRSKGSQGGQHKNKGANPKRR